MCTTWVGMMRRISRLRTRAGRRSLVQPRITKALQRQSEESAVQTRATCVLGSSVVRINRPPGAASG